MYKQENKKAISRRSRVLRYSIYQNIFQDLVCDKVSHEFVFKPNQN